MAPSVSGGGSGLIRRKSIERKSLRKGTKTSKRRKKRKVSVKECDKLWSQIVRASNGGVCYLVSRVKDHVCSGPIQGAHGFSRRYRGTRWDLRNGWPLCAAGHMRFTHDPIGWDLLLRSWWGNDLYDEMQQKAITITKLDYEAILTGLRGEMPGLLFDVAS